MEMEASTSPSNSSPTDLSTGQKMGGRTTTRHPLYRGVRRRSSGKWASKVREPSKRSRIRPEEAAVLALHGDGGAQLNFPAAADIQRVALQAARDHVSTDHPVSSSNNNNINNKSMKNDEGKSGEVEFVDEEAMFNMPLLVDCMAEGMLLTPPAMKKGFNWTQMEDGDGDGDGDFSIWGSSYVPRYI